MVHAHRDDLLFLWALLCEIENTYAEHLNRQLTVYPPPDLAVAIENVSSVPQSR
jgi:hypothetical protein